MVFNSYEFFIFLAIVYALYRVLPLQGQNGLLLIASWLFYGYWDWRFLLLLWISTAVDFISARKIEDAESPERGRAWLILSLVVNLGVLGFFKYFNFFQESFVGLLASFGAQINPLALQIVLPVGISFYTFQTMSYTIDVYRREMRAERDLLAFALYVTFFPQLVAGPIERATSLLPQINKPRKISGEQIDYGLYLIVWGLFKKIVIADNLAPVVGEVYNGVGPFTQAQV